MHRHSRLATKAIHLLVCIAILSTSAPMPLSAAPRPRFTDKTSAEPATALLDSWMFSVPEPSSRDAAPMLDPGPPARIRLSVRPMRDGQAGFWLVAHVTDADGLAVANGTQVQLSAQNGQLDQENVPTIRGFATTRLHLDSGVTEALVTAIAGTVQQTLLVDGETSGEEAVLGALLSRVRRTRGLYGEQAWARVAARNGVAMENNVAVAENSSRRVAFRRAARLLTFTQKAHGQGAEDQSIAFRLTDLRVGQTSLLPNQGDLSTSGNWITYRPEGQTWQMVYEAGDVSAEQFFVFEEGTPVDGDLVIEGRFVTPLTPVLVSDEEGVRFQVPGSQRENDLAYGPARVEDTAGRQTLAQMELDGQLVRLTIPAEWLAYAEFPVVVDPLIGPAELVSELQGEARRPAVASDGTDFLAVWDWNYDVYGQIVDGSGNPTGDLIVINPSGSGQRYANVTYNPISGEYLVTWFDWRYGWPYFGLYAQRVSTTGALIGDEIEISPPLYYQGYFGGAKIAVSDAGDYLAVWSYHRSGTGYDVFAQMLDQTGTPVGDVIEINGAAAEYQRYSDVAYDDQTGTFLVVWANTYGGDVYGQRLDADGTLLGSNTLLVDTSDQDVNESPAVVSNDTGQFLVSWSQEISSSDYDIFAIRVTATTGDVEGSVVGVNTGGGKDVRPAATVISSTQYQVAWEENGWKISARRVDSDGSLPGTTLAEIDQGERPSVAFGSGQSLAVWEDYDTAGQRIITGQRISTGDTTTGDLIYVSPYFSVRARTDLAYSPGSNEYMAAWDQAHGSYNEDVFVQRIDRQGQLLGDAINLSADADAVQDYARIAAGATGYLVTWWDYRDEATIGTATYGQLLDATGNPSGTLIPISTASGDQYVPDVAYNTLRDEYLVAWEDCRDPDDRDVYYQIVGSDGSLQMATEGHIDVAANQGFPRIAYNPDQDTYLIAFHDSRTGNQSADIFGQIVNGDGSLAGDSFRVMGATRGQHRSAVAYSPSTGSGQGAAGGVFLVAWEDPRDSWTYYDIYGQIVSGTGGLVGGEFPIATLSDSEQRYPDVAARSGYTTTEFVVTWQDRRNDYDRDIYLQRVDGAGNLLDEPDTAAVETDPTINVPVAVDADNYYESPSIVYNPDDDVYLLAWNNQDDGGIYVQRYTSGAPGTVSASFEASPDNGTVPLTVSFSDTSTGQIGERVWDFGDGSDLLSTMDTAVEHTYTAAGTFTVTLTISNPGGLDAASGTVVVSERTTPHLDEDFEAHNIHTDPQYWLDQKLVDASDRDEFEVLLDGDDRVLGTDYTDDTHILSTYAIPGWAGWQNYEYTGRMKKTDAEGGFGVTLYSHYPAYETKTYLLGYWSSTGTFVLDEHDGSIDIRGDLDTGVVAESGVWYRFRVQASTETGQVILRAKVWPESESEPASWQAEGYDDSSARPTSGAVGVHTYGAGSKYFDDLAVTSLATIQTDFSATPIEGNVPLTVTFSNLSLPLYGTTGYTWTFGDGATSTLTEPVHTYTTPGAYTVTLTTAVMTETHTLTRTNYITVTSGTCTTPTASFSASPLSGTVPLTVTFTNSSAGDVTGYFWAFGDGGTSTLEHPTHVYTVPVTAGGTYAASLTVSGPCGSDALTRTGYITAYESVVADFTANPTSGEAPLDVDFANLSTGDYDTCAWDFGDGGDSYDCDDPSHTYNSAGTYTVVLTATGSGGSDTFTRIDYVDVTQPTPPPVASFTAAPLSGEAPFQVVFTNTTTGEVTGYEWDFGDGGVSIQEHPTHAYVTGGTFTVSLTATGPGGSDTLTRTNYVTVIQVDYSPVVTITTPAEGAVVGSGDVQVTGLVSDDGTVTGVWVNDVSATLDGATFSATVPLTAGNQVVYAVAQDNLGQAGFASRVVRVDGEGPMVAIHTPRGRQAVYSLYPTATISYTDFYTGVDTATFSATLTQDGGTVTDVSDNFSVGSTGASGTLGGPLDGDATYTLTISIADAFGHTGQDSNTFYVPSDPGEITSPAAPDGTGWVSGVVYDSDTCNEYLSTCQGLPGVHVTVASINHETRVVTGDVTGTIVTGPDGFYAFPVDETGTFALRFEKEGYTYGQREVAVVRAHSTPADDLYLTQVDTATTVISYPVTQTVVHTSTDESLVLEIPPGSLASGQAVTITATNYEHVEFLPSGDLPPGTWETYAFNLGGDSEITFTHPITVRLQNSRGFDPGTKIPLGYWNQTTLQWEHVGVGTVDDTGDWLVMHVEHFSNYDCNDPVTRPGVGGGPDDESCEDGRCPAGEEGCFINLKSGYVHEQIELPTVNVLGQAVAPTIAYDTNRANPSEVIDVRLDLNFNSQVVEIGDYVQFELYVEGQKTNNITFEANPDGSGEVGRYRYLWDGRDALGEQLPPGVYAYAVKLSVPYTTRYYWSSTGRFGGPPNPARPASGDIEATRDYWTYGTVALNAQPDSALGSGWILEEQQQLTEDEAGRIVVSEGSKLTEYYFELADQLDGLNQYDLAEAPVTGPAAEIVISPPPETGGTEVSGTITSNITWTQDSSPYIVTGDVVVTDGVTLTIQPGVTVMLDQYQRLVAEGELQAVGVPTAPITFTAYTDGSYEDWLTYTIPSDANNVGAVTVDEDGNVWFASGYDVDRFDPDLGTWDSYDLCDNYDLLPGWCSDGINDLATDDLGQVWIATNNGAAVLSVTNGVSLTVYQNNEDIGPRSNTVYAVAVDDTREYVWFGAGNYASSFDPDTGDWEAYNLGYCELYDGVRSLAVDVLGHVWMGAGDGLCRVKPDEVGQEDADPWDTYYEGDSITDIAFDHQGNVWMAVYDEEDGQGIRVLTGTAWATYTGWITYTAGSDGLVSDAVTSIAVDGSNRKWVGYKDDGISFLSANNQVWFHETEPRLSDNKVGDIAISPDGTVWVGTYDWEDCSGDGCTGDFRQGHRATHINQVTYRDGTINGGYWGYVQIGGGSDPDDSDGSHLSHVVVESAGVANTQGLYLYQSAPALDNVTIRGSGGDGLYAWESTGFSLDTATIEGNEGSGVRIEGVTAGHVLTNVTSQYNSGHGLYLAYEEGDGEDILVTGTILAHNFGYGVYVQDDSGDAAPILRDSTIEQNGAAARLTPGTVSENNVWADNGNNQIERTGGTIVGDCAWNDDVDAYVVLDDVTVADGVTLTIPAGTTVLFDGCGLQVNGTLSATGTAEETIYFEPVNDQDGWFGLDINGQGGDNGTSHLRYAIIRGANIGLFLYQIDQSTPTLDRLSLVDNTTYGLYVYGSDAAVTIRNSVFARNSIYAIYNYGSEEIDATYNFWNATTGPRTGSSGSGDRVSGGVTYDPWLSKPPLIAGMNYVLANRTATDHTTLAYDADTGLYTRYYPDGREVHFDEDGTHDYTLEPDGRKTTYTYNPDGTVEAIGIYVPDGEDPAWVWEFDYDENDKLMGITDPAGRETEFFVDANGHLTQTVFPDGSSRQFIYDQRNLMTQQMDQGGHVTSYVYDKYGRLIEHVDPLRDVYTSAVLNAGDPAAGQITQTREVRAFAPSDTGYALINDSLIGDPDNPAQAVPTSTQLVDGVTYGRGGRTGHTNVWGRFLDETDGLGRTTTYDYDAANNITGLVWPEGNRMAAEYDDAGNPVSVIRGGSGETQEIVLAYEPRFNHLKTQTDPLGHATTYYYDYELDLGEAGKLVRIEYPPVRDENGITVTPVVSYTYNSWGLLETETDERGSVTCYEYTQDTPMPGLLVAVVRDCEGLELTTTYGDFDALGNARAVTGTSGTVTRYLYDEMGRVVSQTNALGITTLSEYDARGNLVRQVADYTPDGTTGRNVVTEYEYDADGRSVGRRTETAGQVVQTSSAYDVNGELAYQEDTRGNASVSVYDDADQLVSRTDPTGNVTAYAYDLNGRQETVTDTRDIVTRKEYDDYGYVVRSVTNWDDGVFDPAEPEKDVETRYEYDLAGNTIVVSDTLRQAQGRLLGHATRTWYDARGRTLGTIANWDGETTLAECFAQGAPLPPVRDENICTLYAYDIAGSTVIVTDTLGRMTRTFYDALGRVEARVANWNPATLASPADCTLSPDNESDENVCTLYGYDVVGNQITTTNALDQTSLTIYDENNRPIIHVANWDGTTSITSEADCSFPPTLPDTNLCTVTYYDRDQRSGTKDPLGHLTEFGYDAHGRLITTTRTLDGAPVVTVNHYDALGNRVGQTDARGNTTTYVYDHLGRLETTLSAEGVANTQGYDEFGRVVTATDGLGHETITGYDVLGRQSRRQDAGGHTTWYGYDALGNRTVVTDANNVRTSYLYDELNRMVGVIENDTGGESTNDSNVLTQYVYDALGNRVVITNARNYTSTTTVYDGLDRAVIVRDALGHETHTRYDALGNRTAVTDADGGVTYYGYDGLNRLVSIEYPEFTVQYAYDAAGNRTVMTDSVGVTYYVYDDLGRLTSVDDPITGTVSYGYDLAGNRTQLTYPTGEVVTYTYNADNRLIQVEDWDGGLTTYGYDDAGRLTATELPNGVVTVNEYDDAGRLVNLTHTDGDEMLLSGYEYELDGVGNRVRVTETLTGTTRTITNVYDPLGRLTSADYSTSESFEYVYDAVGNRRMVTSTTPLSGTVVTTYTFDAADRLTDQVRSDGRAYTYTWSARGQMLAEYIQGIPVRTFSYDGAGRMIEATVFTLTTRFTYNGLGARVAVEVVGHSTTTYTLDYAAGNRVLAEATDDSSTHYLYGHTCLGELRNDDWLYYLNDATGYLRQGADTAGEVVSGWLFDPDGTVLKGPEGPVSHLICGGVYDWSTGLIYRGGRYFDPMLGIWLALMPLMVVQSWKGQRKKQRRFLWRSLLISIVCLSGALMVWGKGSTIPETLSKKICTPIPTPPMEAYITPTDEHANVRSGPTAAVSTANFIGELRNGVRAEPIGQFGREENGIWWWKIRYTDQGQMVEGWVRSDVVTLVGHVQFPRPKPWISPFGDGVGYRVSWEYIEGTHNGIDLVSNNDPKEKGEDTNIPGNKDANVLGREVFAMTDGVILHFPNKADIENDYWMNVLHEHPDGKIYWLQYTHFKFHDESNLSLGTFIEQEKFLGYYAEVGRSSGPHLHITIKDTDSENPSNPAGELDPTPFIP